MKLVALAQSAHHPMSKRATAQVFVDPKSKELLAHVEKVAPSDASVLISGETGTGKELVARHIHNLSKRAKHPFIAVNCGAFSDSMVEADLFGYEKGAFTGALSAKPGWFEEANGGTLFLDEIGDLPLSVQVKLLRLLQEREVVRLGSRKVIPIDVRIVAATNVRLEQAISDGKFREDLFYRLNVVNLHLHALRERPGDILPLVRHFIELYSARLGYGNRRLSTDTEDVLTKYAWPGNVRELENVIHHTLLTCRDTVIHPDELKLPSVVLNRQSDTTLAAESPEDLIDRAFQALVNQGADDIHRTIENAVLRAAFCFCRYNQVQTAKLLGLTRNVTRARLIEIGELQVTKRGAAPPKRTTHRSDPSI